jgi:mRNA-degrading endonuclease toxin of MazEF toxin-antitoxin module
MSPEQLRRNPRRFRRSSRACSACSDARGAPISVPVHADASSIQAGTTVTTPGSTSICTNRPRGTIIGPLDPDAPTEQRMPAVMDHGILPDMGRMDG